jgi:UDP-N-acetylmuramyl pentapeptide synthase
MNNNNELTSDTFHTLVTGSAAEVGQRQEAFVDSLLSVLAEYGFDGVASIGKSFTSNVNASSMSTQLTFTQGVPYRWLL